MQNKNKNNRFNHHLRLAHERTLAMSLIGSLMVGSIAISHEVRRTVSEVAVHPMLAVIEHSNRESETMHRAMRLESDMNAELIGGE